ncbi:MAG: hypothetical protein OXC79_10285 [Candidatus Poribacteria bacterium]|nr:hypothetical protein [Candidatus Poribacteria bacterium]
MKPCTLVMETIILHILRAAIAVKVFRTICPYPLDSGYGELPAGGATLRRWTF